MESNRPPIPGTTGTYGDPCTIEPFVKDITAIQPVVDRGVILLSTATITEENIYSNGLFQNVFVFYRMFEAMGYAPILIVHEKPKKLDGIPGPLRKCRTIVTEDILRSPISNLVAIIEIGMSMDPLARQFIKMLGGRILKVYLGNILNIDIETPIFLPGHHFAHHVIGRSDLILVSPHYAQHVEYATCINQVPPTKDHKQMIAPYVWDSNIVTRDGTQTLRWSRPVKPEDQVFVIMEPNISFQKASLVPLLIVERWYREVGKAADWKGRVVIVNGERLEMVPHFVENIEKTLDLYKDGKIQLEERYDIVSALKEWPSATFVLHNYNNEYNYMTLELLWAGFPVLHNSPSWKSFGYYYEAADLKRGCALIEDIRRAHADKEEAYKAQAAVLSWRHSPYNPDNQAAWRDILEKR